MDESVSHATEHPDLRRAIGPWMLFFFVLGDIVGAGIYALVGEVGAVVGGAIWSAFLFSFILAIFTAGYDTVGNRVSVLELDGTRLTFGYDRASQLVNEQRSGAGGYNTTYQYDGTGNQAGNGRPDTVGGGAYHLESPAADPSQ